MDSNQLPGVFWHFQFEINLIENRNGQTLDKKKYN